MSLAWETTYEDVETVLKAWDIDPNDINIRGLAPDWVESFIVDYSDEIEKYILDYDDMIDQTNAMLSFIEDKLMERGHIIGDANDKQFNM